MLRITLKKDKVIIGECNTCKKRFAITLEKITNTQIGLGFTDAQRCFDFYREDYDGDYKKLEQDINKEQSDDQL